jgi:thioredoxin reductase (NADPH)
MHDMLIIGGGMAGLTAGIYAKRAGLDVLLFEKMFTGGQIATTYSVENYPGFDEPITGPELAMKIENHARKFGLEILYDEVIGLKLDEKIKRVYTENREYEAKTIILAMGAQPKTLGLTKEDNFRGRGVSYCATCDGAFYRDKRVAVVGGGDTAAEDALFLAQYVNKVYLIHRRNELRAYKLLQKKVVENKKIELVLDSVVDQIIGETEVSGVLVSNVKNGQSATLDVDGIFVAIGIQPNSSLVKDSLVTDEAGFVIADECMKTSLQGVFVAGDLRKKPMWQIITAASDGAIATLAAQRYIIEEYE